MSGLKNSVFQTLVPEHGISDPHVMPTKGVLALVAGEPVLPGRAILLDVTGAGTVTYTLLDGSVISLNLQVGQIYEFNDSVVMLGTGTATLTAWNKY